MRQLEAVAAGALRREQAADATAKRLAAEIEQLTRLVNPKPFLSNKPQTCISGNREGITDFHITLQQLGSATGSRYTE
jgi:hypothetical protein